MDQCVKETLTDVGIIDAASMVSRNNESLDGRCVAAADQANIGRHSQQQHAPQQAGATPSARRSEADHVHDSQQHHHHQVRNNHQFILGSDFCLNAPRPDDSEDDDDDGNDRGLEGIRIGATSNYFAGPDANRVVPLPNMVIPVADAVAPSGERHVTYSEQSNQDSMVYRQERGLPYLWVWARQRRWNIILMFMLLASIVVNILLALDLRNYGRGNTGAGNSISNPPLISVIRARGSLSCGVVEYPGLSHFNNTTGTWTGFEVDLCRAVGAAIWADGGKINFIPMTYGERFTALQSRKVDLLAAGATYTMERDLYESTAQAGFTFSVPYLYDGVSFAGQPQYVECAYQFRTTGNCSDLRICVQDNTTHVQVIQALFRGSAIYLAPTKDFYVKFKQGLCNVLAGQQFDLAQRNVQQAGYTGPYNFSNNLYSKEPIALVTRDDDDVEWSDFVNWVVLLLLTAEIMNITQATAQLAVERRPVEESLMSSYRVVAAVGNYAELYKRSLESIVPRTQVNQQNDGTTPLIYAFPFGNNSTTGPGPVANGTLQKILQRGYLRCGTADVRFFAKFNQMTQEWEGFDVDYCRAVSAAIFNGRGSTVFVAVTGTDRWGRLAREEVDLISWDTTWNYERDVMEPSTKTGFTFTQPNFYTGIQFGGVPPFGDCADRLDVLSQNCTHLKICVNNGTTTYEGLQRLFSDKFIKALYNDEAVDECLTNGQGNAFAADGFLTAESLVKEQYSGSYQAGSHVYTRENLAMVTRQDDPQWSSFVNWVVMATFYAQEKNITQATAHDHMPTTNLLGPDFSSMLQNAILAVGSHGDIIARNNVNGKYKINAINRLNTYPFGPQHFPPGGLFHLY